MSEGMVLERLAAVHPDWTDVERRSRRLQKQHLRRQALLTAGGLLAAAILAGGAYAAAREIWSGHNMTPADINAQATTVYNDPSGTHTELQILPSMGVTFVLPDGDTASVVPAADVWTIPATFDGETMRDDSGNSWGSGKPLEDSAGNWIGGVWTVPLPNGGTRTITWYKATGALSVTDSVGGVTTTQQLVAGDVVPLVPGSLSGDPRTLDKAVTFDLPTGNPVIIFPQLNESYVGWVSTPTAAEPLPYDTAAQYGLTPIGHFDGKLPVTPSGGTWTANLLGGLTRTISWHAGDSYVTVTDTTAAGTTTTQVPIGHELPLVPFK